MSAAFWLEVYLRHRSCFESVVWSKHKEKETKSFSLHFYATQLNHRQRQPNYAEDQQESVLINQTKTLHQRGR